MGGVRQDRDTVFGIHQELPPSMIQDNEGKRQCLRPAACAGAQGRTSQEALRIGFRGPGRGHCNNGVFLVLLVSLFCGIFLHHVAAQADSGGDCPVPVQLYFNQDTKPLPVAPTLGSNWYRWVAQVFITNRGSEALSNWSFTIDWQYGELITKVNGAQTTPEVMVNDRGEAVDKYPAKGIRYSAPIYSDAIATSSQADGDLSRYQLVVTIEGIRVAGPGVGDRPKGVRFSAPAVNCSGTTVGRDGASFSCCSNTRPTNVTRAPVVLPSVCPGMLLQYYIDRAAPVTNGSNPLLYSFTGRIQLTNRGSLNVSQWALQIGFKNNETLTDIQGALFTGRIPASGNTWFYGDPNTNLMIPAAGNRTKDFANYATTIVISGFGESLALGQGLLPASITFLSAAGIIRTCNSPGVRLSSTTLPELDVCCPIIKSNKTEPLSNATLSLQTGYGGLFLGQCYGVLVEYSVDLVRIIPPIAINPANQSYRFESTIQISNFGTKDLKGWGLAFNFSHNELVTEVVGNAKTDDVLPIAGEELTIGGVPYKSDSIPTSVNVAGDDQKYKVWFRMIGSEFGGAKPAEILPLRVNFISDRHKCLYGQENFPVYQQRMQLCCPEVGPQPPPPPPAILDVPDLNKGSIDIRIDVVDSQNDAYWALWTIINKQPYRRVEPPGWKLGFSWQEGEVIWEIKGATATEQGDCLNVPATVDFGPQLQNAHTCLTRPTLVDLPSARYDGDSAPDYTRDGTKLSCCKNGTLGLGSIPGGDPRFWDVPGNATLAQFRMRVGKTRLGVGFDHLVPPYNFSIGLKGYQCSRTVNLISNTQFDLDVQHSKQSVVTWLARCVLVDPPTPKCCVSFSAFYNRTRRSLNEPKGIPLLSPCPTCSCGCTASDHQNESALALAPSADVGGALADAAEASATQPICDAGLPDPAHTLVAPNRVLIEQPSTGTLFNRTPPGPPPPSPPPPSASSGDLLPACSNECGVNVHWHIRDQWDKGWQSKLTILNQDTQPIKNWFVAVQMRRVANLTQVFSFDHDNVTDDTVLMWGSKGYNDWLVGTKGKSVGNLQTLMEFQRTIFFNMTKGHAFPLRIIFNGDECTMPLFNITSDGKFQIPAKQTGYGWVILGATVFAWILAIGATFIGRA